MKVFFAEYKASPKYLGSPQDLIIIPLNAMLMLDPEYEAYQIANIGDWFGAGDHAAMHGRVEALWNEFQHCYIGENKEYLVYEFHVLATQFVYYQSVVREALTRYRPTEVYCCERFDLDNDKLNDLAELSTILRGLVIDEEIGALKRKCVPKYSFGFSSKYSKMTSLGTQFFFRPTSFYLRLLRKMGRSPSKILPIAYFGQVAKGVGLQYLLRTQLGGDAETIDHFLERPEGLGLKYEDKKPINKALISNFLNYATSVEKYYDQCATIAKGPWKLLLTCNHARPLERCLIDAFLSEGKPVGIFSEGVGQQNERMNRYIENFFYWPHNATGFLLSEYLLGFYRKKGLNNSFLVTGYFGSSYDSNKIAELFFKGWFRMRGACRRTSNKRVILYALTALSGHKIARFFCEETPHEVPHHLHEFLSQVDSSRYTVIVKLHGGDLGLKSLKARYRALDVHWFVNVPWEVLASVADCVVIFHSSVGLESLAMKKPVLIWNPTKRATFASTYSEKVSSVLSHVERKEDIPAALEKLMDHDPRDFSQYEYFFAQAQKSAISWLKDNMH